MFIQGFSPRAPTPSLNEDASPVLIAARQATTTILSTAIPAPGCGGSYSGGTLAGAVLGTFFGTVLVLFMFQVIRPDLFTRKTVSEEVVVEKRRRHTSRS